jgi:pimeloyl-ACP methyl ester carboxylesterase
MKTVATRKSTNVRKYLELLKWRATFALGGIFLPSSTAEHAARLFATPFATARNRARAFESNDVVSRADFHRGLISAGSRSLSTYVWGDPTRERYALLVHGWSSFGLRFASWVARLRAAGYAVVAFDHPAHGNSNGTLATLPEFAEAVSTVGAHFGNAALAIGHSLGGAAIMLAQDERWRAERIVLIAPPADMTMAVDRYFRFLRLGDHLRGRFYAWHKQRTGIDARTLSLAQRLRAFGQPGLIVHDVDDREVPWGEGERYALHWNGARLLTTQGLGHNRILDDARVIDAALAFARGEIVGDHVQGSPGLM